MKNLVAVFALFFFLALFSCQRTGSVLSQIDVLAGTNPDSAWSLLNSINDVEGMDRADRAAYYLQLTRVKDKRYMPLDHDSLLDYSLAYYKEQNDALKIAMCWFYKGRMFFEAARNKEATQCFKEAEHWALLSGDCNIIGLVYNYLGLVKQRLGQYEEALGFHRKSLNCGLKQQNASYIIDGLNNMGKSFAFLGRLDSARCYFSQSLTYLEDEPLKQAFVYYNIGVFFFDAQEFSEASFYIRQSISKEKEGSSDMYSSYAMLGNIYYAEGKADSADYCWNKSLETSSLAVKECTYGFFYNRYLQEENYKEATKYAELYIQYADSIYRSSTAKEVAEIQAKYDNLSLRSHQLEYDVKVATLRLLILVLVILSIISLWWILRRQARKKEKLKRFILQREEELLEMKEELLDLQKANLSYQGENESLAQQCDDMQFLIEQKEQDIALTKKDGEKQLHLQRRKTEMECSIGRGASLLAEIDNYKWSSGFCPEALDASDFKDIIGYYRLVDEAFINKLEKRYSFTPMEVTVCILFRKKLDQAQIADIMGSSKDTFTRTKTRIKSKIREVKAHTLEEVIIFL